VHLPPFSRVPLLYQVGRHGGVGSVLVRKLLLARGKIRLSADGYDSDGFVQLYIMYTIAQMITLLCRLQSALKKKAIWEWNLFCHIYAAEM
jgi:hypothetical protein